MKSVCTVGATAFFTLCFSSLCFGGDDVISRSMELRYYSEIPEANGVTDFRGSTEVFSTDQRIDYLKTYERLAGQFFNNPNWDKKVVTDEEAKERLSAIKPQPLPEVRKRIPLGTWKWLACGMEGTSRSSGSGRKPTCRTDRTDTRHPGTGLALYAAMAGRYEKPGRGVISNWQHICSRLFR
jgi:hypothetical protein